MSTAPTTRWYDMAISYWCERDDMFLRRLKEYTAQNGVNLLIVEPLWCEDVLRKYEERKLGIRILLDLCSEPHDPANHYTRLSMLAKERGAHVINDPHAAARFSHKGEAHLALKEAGFPVPFGVVTKLEDADTRTLTDEERLGLGASFFIKPCHGFGGKGVICDAKDIKDILRSHAVFPDTHFLLQRRVEIGELAGQPAYWRMIYVLGEIHLCWWNPQTKSYRVALQWQIEDFGLWPMFELGQRLATATGLEFFSVEVARSKDNIYRLVDYINEQIDLRPKSFSADGVPDELVRRVAKRVSRFVEELRPAWGGGRDMDSVEEWLPTIHERCRTAGRPWAAHVTTSC